MEILQYLLSFFIKEYGKDFAPLFELLQKNGFNLKRTLSNANLETLAPIIKAFMERRKKTAPKIRGYLVMVFRPYQLLPIKTLFLFLINILETTKKVFLRLYKGLDLFH